MKFEGGIKYITLMLLSLLSACSGVKDSSTLITLAATVSPTPTPTYDCTYNNFFNTLSDCENGTRANCSSQWVTFPTGGVSQCYVPPDNWANCASSPATWIYTAYQSCGTGTVSSGSATAPFYGYRSVISCSDTICKCMDPQVTRSVVCTDAVTSPCATPTPAPGGTPFPIPTCP